MDYIYAVARIRSKELSLLTSQNIEQLIASKDKEECVAFLREKGWGAQDGSDDEQAMLSYERNKTWDLIRELCKDMEKFDVFLYSNDYHNLKAAIKSVCTVDREEPDNIYIKQGTVDSDLIFTCVRDKEYMLLPEGMRIAAQRAYEELLHTGDGQLCDCIVDKAALDAIYKAGKAAQDETIKTYAELTVACADIKTAFRACMMGKSYDFIYDALAECDTLDIKRMAKASSVNLDALCEYLSVTKYSQTADMLKNSPSSFERWCDNEMIAQIKPQKYESFSIGPLVAYMIARENEIKMVRIILACKQNDFDEQIIRERLREMYA